MRKWAAWSLWPRPVWFSCWHWVQKFGIAILLLIRSMYKTMVLHSKPSKFCCQFVNLKKHGSEYKDTHKRSTISLYHYFSVLYTILLCSIQSIINEHGLKVSSHFTQWGWKGPRTWIKSTRLRSDTAGLSAGLSPPLLSLNAYHHVLVSVSDQFENV